MTRAIREWRRQFRGDPRVIDDTALDDTHVARSNLIFWGDPDSNRGLAKVAGRLPVRWEADAIRVGEASYPAAGMPWR